MTARESSGGRILYYFQRDKKKVALGTDPAEALRQWKILKRGKVGSGFVDVADAYEKHLKDTISASSLPHYRAALDNLRDAFGAGTLEQIKPMHVKQYIRRRTKKGAALMEKKILSAMWNWAREDGITETANPCAGVKFSKAERRMIGRLGRRERYVTDAEFSEVHGRADPVLQDAMDLAYRTGQRPSDLLKMTRQDIKDGVLMIVQEKTGAKVPIAIEGKLKVVLERALARPRRIQSMYVIADEHGQRITYGRLNKSFVKARRGADWQFRDIRAKTSTDLPNIKRAQELLGHADEQTTTVYRRSKGLPIAPLDRDLEQF